MASTKRVLSVNVGQPRKILWQGKSITTCIFKEPVAARVPVRRLNLDGDQQASLNVHGGPYKAVYVYPAEHYDYWRKEFPDRTLPFGMFGENLTTEGVLETEVHIGDRFRVGSAEVQVTQPRIPCFKLEAKFGRDDMIERFLASHRSGFYLEVVKEGEVGAGDAVEPIHRDENRVTVSEIVRLFTTGQEDLEGLRRAAQLNVLGASWRERFRQRIERIEAGSSEPS